MKKLFVVQKYIPARSPAEAIAIEKNYPAMECFLDAEWRKNNPMTVDEKAIIGY